MTTAQDVLKRLASDELQPVFKARGFKKKALTFYRRVGDNFALVNLQKSRSATARSADFTINLSVFSGRVQRGLAPLTWVPEVRDVPTEADCHLRARIGSLMPERQDKWWTARDDTAPPELSAKIRSVLEGHAFPFLEARVSDEGLRDHWRKTPNSGRDGLLLAILLRDIGPREELGPLLDLLRREAPPTATGFVAAIERFAQTLASGA